MLSESVVYFRNCLDWEYIREQEEKNYYTDETSVLVEGL